MATVTCVSDDEFSQLLLNHELQNGVKFIVRKSRHVGVSRVDSLLKFRVLFEDGGRQSVPVEYDGVPFIVISSDNLECQFGSGRVPKECEEKDDHFFGKECKPTRRLIQDTKKMGCTAGIKLRRVVKFPEYQIQGPDSKWKRLKMSKELKGGFCKETEQQYLVLVQFVGVHSNHVTGKFSAYGNRLDEQVILNIKHLAKEGVTNVSEVQRRCEQLSQDILPNGHNKSDRRFYPTRKDIYNHLYNTLGHTSSTKDDQMKVAEVIGDWQGSAEEGSNIFFRPMSETDQLLIVVQTHFQKHLLQKYGNEVCLLDSTYNTTKYTVPLSFVCVKTNTGYQVVATFLLAKETSANITEALKMISKWNPGWKPEYWVTDFDQREISALENTFPGTQVLLCTFHREQAWQRWLGSKKNGVVDQKDMILKHMRSIAHSSTEEIYKEEVAKIRDLEIYHSHAAFRNWIDRYWLPESKRWVQCFRQIMFNISVNTTNGLERQHRTLKENFLKKNGFGGTLTSLITILLKKFFPAMEEKYVKSNIMSQEQYRQFSRHLPKFLRGKPLMFINHCLQRLPPKAEQVDKYQVKKMQNPDLLQFSVSSTSGNIYIVEFEHNIPVCSCPDYSRHHWPCKHVLAIFEHFPENGWDSLNGIYINQPCFNLDSEILKKVSDDHMPIVVDETVKDTEFSSKVHETAAIPDLPAHSNKEKDPVRVRKTCVELLKNIQNHLYATNDIEVLCTLREKLNELDTILDSNSTTICDIPTRRNIRARRVQNKKVKYGKKINEVKSKNIVEENIQVDVDAEETEVVVPLSPEYEEFVKVVDELWNSTSEQDYQIGRVGPYILTAKSIQFLQNTLSDEVIDSYLHTLCHSSVLHISCVVMTSIFTGSNQIHSLMRQQDVFNYQYCIGAINEGGSHWTLMIICPNERKLLYLNPLGEMNVTMQLMLQRWYAFLHARYTAGVEEHAVDGWEIGSPQHARQIDGLSCGVYVLKLAEKFLNGTSVDFHWTRNDLLQTRKEIACRLLHATDQTRKEINTSTTPPTGPEQSQLDHQSPYPSTIPEQSHTPPTGPEQSQLDHQSPVPPTVPEQSQLDHQSHTPPTGPEQSDIDHPSPYKQDQGRISQKRKRRDERKSTIYVYGMMKRTYCVCRKINDGRLYWQCHSCIEWYHPDCLGLNESKEPDVFICPACQDNL